MDPPEVEVKLDIIYHLEEEKQNFGEKEGSGGGSSMSSCLVCLQSWRSSSSSSSAGGSVHQHWKELWRPNSSGLPPTLTQGLSCIFLLRNLLQVPTETVATLLSRTAGEVVDPVGAWCTLCDNCAGLVEVATRLFQECLKLQRQVEDIGEQLRGRVKNSVESGACFLEAALLDDDEDVVRVEQGKSLNPQAFIRRYFKGIKTDVNEAPPKPSSRTTSREGRGGGGGNREERKDHCSVSVSGDNDVSSEQQLHLEHQETGMNYSSDLIEGLDDCKDDSWYTPPENDDQADDDDDEEDTAPVPVQRRGRSERVRKKRVNCSGKRAKLDAQIRTIAEEDDSPDISDNSDHSHSHHIKSLEKERRITKMKQSTTTSTRKPTKLLHSCEKCDFKADTKDKVIRHSWHHLREEHFVEVVGDGDDDEDKNQSLFRCKHCSVVVHTWSQHLKEIHTSEIVGVELLTCHICGSVFFDPKSLSNHLNMVHGAKPFKCRGCTSLFETEDKLRAHMSRKHPNGISRHICEFCGTSFALENGVKIHQKKFHPEQVSASSGKGNSVAPHLISGGGAIHPPPPPSKKSSQVKCRVCGLPVIHSKVLGAHLKSCHPELYRHACDLCDARYMTLKDLREHKESKHSSKKAVCPYCAKESNSEKALLTHWKTYCKKYPGKRYKGFEINQQVSESATPAEEPAKKKGHHPPPDPPSSSSSAIFI